MDDIEGWDLDPRVDAAFFWEWGKQFQQYSKDIQKGIYAFDPLQSLDILKQNLKRLEGISIVTRVAELCAKLPPLEVDEKGKPVEKIREGEVIAHWQIAYFQGKIDTDQLEADAARVTEEKLRELFAAFQEAKNARDKAQDEVASVPAKTAARQEALKVEIEKTDAFQAARTELLDLIGPKDETFKPQTGEYEQKWQDVLRKRYESLGIERGRGVAPDAARVKAERKKRNWKQADLVDHIKEISGVEFSIRTIRRLEAAKRVQPDTLRVVARAFGMELEDLIPTKST